MPSIGESLNSELINSLFYKIKEPITLKDLKSKFGFSAPQSFVYLDKYKELKNYLLNKAILEKIY